MAKKSNSNAVIIHGSIGYGIAMLLDLISAMVVSIFIFNEYFTIEQTVIIVFITHMIATFLGVRFIMKRAGERKIQTALVLAGAYYITQIIAAMLLFDGISSSNFINIIPILAGSVGAILLGTKPKKRTKRRRN